MAAREKELAARKKTMSDQMRDIEECDNSIKRWVQAVSEQAKALEVRKEAASASYDGSKQPSVTTTSAKNTRAQQLVAENLAGRDPTTISIVRAVIIDARPPRVQHAKEVMTPSDNCGKAKPL